MARSSRTIEIQLYDHTTEAEIAEIVDGIIGRLGISPEHVHVRRPDEPLLQAAPVRAIEALEGYVDVHGVRGHSLRVQDAEPTPAEIERREEAERIRGRCSRRVACTLADGHAGPCRFYDGTTSAADPECTCGGRGMCTRCVLSQLQREEELRASGFDPERADRTDSAA